MNLDLDIQAFDEKALKKQEEDFKDKYGFSLDAFWYEVKEPDKNDFAYRIHPALYQEDIKKYHEIDEVASTLIDPMPVYIYTIRYNAFARLRNSMLKLIGANIATDTCFLLLKKEHPKDIVAIDILDFFLTSDNNRIFYSVSDLTNIYNCFNKLCQKQKLAEVNDPNIEPFLNFLAKSVKNNWCWKYL